MLSVDQLRKQTTVEFMRFRLALKPIFVFECFIEMLRIIVFNANASRQKKIFSLNLFRVFNYQFFSFQMKWYISFWLKLVLNNRNKKRRKEWKKNRERENRGIKTEKFPKKNVKEKKNRNWKYKWKWENWKIRATHGYNIDFSWVSNEMNMYLFKFTVRLSLPLERPFVPTCYGSWSRKCDRRLFLNKCIFGTNAMILLRRLFITISEAIAIVPKLRCLTKFMQAQYLWFQNCILIFL